MLIKRHALFVLRMEIPLEQSARRNHNRHISVALLRGKKIQYATFYMLDYAFARQARFIDSLRRQNVARTAQRARRKI